MVAFQNICFFHRCKGVRSLSNSKRGVIFPILMSVYLVIIFVLILVFIKGNFEKIQNHSKVQFQTLKDTDYVLMEKEADLFYNRNKLNFVIGKLDDLFMKNLVLLGLKSNAVVVSQSSNSNSLNTQNNQELESCFYNGVSIWYNQFYDLKTAKLSGADISSKDNCLPNFKGFEKKYEAFVKSKVSSYFPDSKIEVESNDKNFVILLSSDLGYKPNSVIQENYKIKRTIEKSDIPILLNDIHSVLVNLSEIYREKVPLCVEKEKKSELECMNEIFNKKVFKSNNIFTQKYKFKLNYVDSISKKTNDKFYGLNVSLFKNGGTEKLFGFMIILKDNIPYSPLIFKLTDYKALNDVVELDIEKPSYSNSVKNYLVVYSYNNFLSDKYSKYGELIKAFQNGDIPLNLFTDSSLIDQDNNKYFYSKDLGITVMLSKSDNFVQVGTKSIKKILLYQIFNPKTEKFELLSKNVYVYVFAIDENYNLFINNIKNKAEVGEVKSVLGADPLKTDEVSVTGDIPNFEKSLSLSVDKYQSKFDHFNIYLFNSNGKVNLNNCAEKGLCYFYDGKNILTETQLGDNGSLSFLITSMENFQSKDKLVLNTNQFQKSFSLENGKIYSLAIIPINSEGKGVLEDTSVQKFQLQDVSSNFNVIDKSYLYLSPLVIKGVKVVDRRMPTINDIVLGDLFLKNGVLYLNWNPKVENSIKELTFSMTIKTETGQIIGPTPLDIGLDGRVVTMKNNYKEIELKNLKIVDGNGNIGIVNSVVRNYPKVSS